MITFLFPFFFLILFYILLLIVQDLSYLCISDTLEHVRNNPSCIFRALIGIMTEYQPAFEHLAVKIRI